MAEQPTVKEPTMEPTRTPENASDDIIAKLKDLEIDSPERLEGMARASSEAGNLAKMVGELRGQNEQLNKKLDELTRHRPPANDYDYGEPSIDLEQAIRKGTRAEITAILNEQQESQKKAQQAYYRDMSKIQNDKRYKALREPWERHVQNPTTQLKLQSGETTIVDEYYRIKDAYLDILEDTYTNKVSNVSQPVNPPHMESGETQTNPMPRIEPTSKEELRKKVNPDKGYSGTDEDIKDLFSSVFAENDPFLGTAY